MNSSLSLILALPLLCYNIGAQELDSSLFTQRFTSKNSKTHLTLQELCLYTLAKSAEKNPCIRFPWNQLILNSLYVAQNINTETKLIIANRLHLPEEEKKAKDELEENVQQLGAPFSTKKKFFETMAKYYELKNNY